MSEPKYISDKSKVALTLGGLASIIITVVVCTFHITTAFERNSTAVLSLQASQWRISDQLEYAAQSEKLNRKQVPAFESPDVKAIVNGRLTSPKKNE